jgi:hypothetical protein
MNAGQKLALVEAIVVAIKANMVAADGTLKPLSDLSDISSLIQAVEAAITSAGITIPADIQKVIAGLVAVLAIV